jgi:hypothetical protein
VLLATWKWKDSILEINTVNSIVGLKDVSVSNLSKIRKLDFPLYDAKKLGDNLPIAPFVIGYILFGRLQFWDLKWRCFKRGS